MIRGISPGNWRPSFLGYTSQVMTDAMWWVIKLRAQPGTSLAVSHSLPAAFYITVPGPLREHACDLNSWSSQSSLSPYICFLSLCVSTDLGLGLVAALVCCVTVWVAWPLCGLVLSSPLS